MVIKNLKFQKHIFEIDKGSFVPVVFSCMGEAGPSAQRTKKTLARNLRNEKKTTPTRTQ